MFLQVIVVGPLQVNCYIVADENSNEAIVIDPGDEPDRIMEIVKENNLKVKYIVCTHGHFDHVGAVTEIKEETGAKIIIHKDELEIYCGARDQAAFWGYELAPLPEPDIFVDEGDNIGFGNLSFVVIHTPGHSPGSISLYSENVVFTGDTLFAGSVGRTDFYGGDIERLKKSFLRLLSLPSETKVFSGHGPSSTILREKAGNFFLGEI